MYKVTLYNQSAMCGYSGIGKTRRKAFNVAMGKTNREFMIAKINLHEMFVNIFNDMVADIFYRNSPFVTFSHPRGIAIDIEKVRE